MSAPEFILYDVDLHGIANITLNRPEKLNALCWPLMEELERVLRAAEKDPAVRVIILRGAGRCFSVGYDFLEVDLSKIGKGSGPADGVDEPRGVPDYGRGLWNSRAHVQGHIHYEQVVWNLWKPVIAQVHGFAFGGASTLAIVSDLTMVSDDLKLGYPPTRWLATGDNVALYSFAAGLKKAKEMSFGRLVTGAEAVDWGLANYCVPADQLAERTYEEARKIAEIEPELLMLNKQVVNRTWEIMGIKTAMEIGGEFDTLCHIGGTLQKFRDTFVENKGSLRDTLKKINEPWGGI